MVYLTHQQVQQEAEKSRQAAIKCSIRHWEELCDAPLTDLKEGKVWPSGKLCALCIRYRYQHEDICKNCPLNKAKEGCFNIYSLYSMAMTFLLHYTESPTLLSERKYREAAQKLVIVLKSFLQKN